MKGSGTTDSASQFERSFIATKRFRLIRRLGAGAMGVVYLAHDLERRQDVALKTLRQIDGPTLLHFKREFRALAGISHPNLVSLYELFHVGDQWFFTMEVAEGQSFIDWVRPQVDRAAPRGEPPTIVEGLLPTPVIDEPIDKTIDQAIETIDDNQVVAGFGPVVPPLDESRFRDAFRQLAEGVHALHRAGRLHRDLKPSNVRVMASGRVVILDFGLVAELGPEEEHVHTSDRVVGTAGYMSPEQASGMPLSPPSDWYAVGSMIFEALTTTRPFVGAMLEVLIEKTKANGPHPRFRDPSVPEDLDFLTAGLLKLDPFDRPTGEEVLVACGGRAGRSLMFRDTKTTGRLLIGRDEEVRQLRRAFLATDREQSMTIWVRGESGLGKSALVSHFLDTLHTVANAVVLKGACHEHEAVRYRAFDSVIDALARYLGPIHSADIEKILPNDIDALVRLFPVLRAVPTIENRVRDRLAGVPSEVEPREIQLRAFRALRALLSELARRMAVVIWIDDLQWGDKDSAPLFYELLSPPDAPHVMLIGSYRADGQKSSPLVELLEAAREGAFSAAETIDLEPLSFAQARELATKLLSPRTSDAEALSTAIARESGGNPYFVVELLRHLERDGDDIGSVDESENRDLRSFVNGLVLARNAAGDDVAEHQEFTQTVVSANVTLDEVVAARVDLLPADAQKLLETIIVAVGPMTLDVAATAAGIDNKPEAALRLLESGNFVRVAIDAEGEDRIAPYHPRVRDAVIRRITPDLMKRTHGRIAAALRERSPDDVEALALHSRGAGQSVLAASYAKRAAEIADRGLAFDRAAELYAIAATEPGDPSLASRHAAALANAGRGLEAAEVYLKMARTRSSAEGVDLRRRAAEQLLRTGYVDRGVEVLEHVLEDIGLSLTRAPKRALASLVRSRMAVRLRGLRFSRTSAEELDKAKLERVDVLWAVATGLGMVDSTLGTDFQSRHLVEALQVGEPYRVARALAMEACYSATGGVGTRRRTSKVVALASRLAEEIDDPHALGLAEMAKGAAAFLEGRFDEGRRCSERAESILRERCTGVLWEIATAQVFHVLSLVFLGELGALQAFVRKNVREAHARGDRYALANLRSGGGNLAYLVRDDVDGARRALEETRGHLPEDGFAIPHFYELIARVNLLLYEGRGAAAFRAVDEVRDVATRSVVLRVQYLRIDVDFLYARAALASSAVVENPEPLFREAEDRAKRLGRAKADWAHPLASLVWAGVIEGRRHVKDAIDAYAVAAEQAEARGMLHITNAARARQGSLLGGADGQSMVEGALAFFRRERVVRPERMAKTFAPATFAGT